MGPLSFEIDNEGRADLWVSDSKYNRLLKNDGKLGFTDITEKAGISQWTGQYTSWGTGVHDFDNDGLKDILIFHGGLIHMVPQEHSLFRNLGGGRFQDVSTAGGAFFQTKTVGRGACFADYDSDGKVDAFLVNLGSPGQLLHNTTAGAAHWLDVRLIGTKSNRDGIGTTVSVTTDGVTQKSERVAGSGYLGQDDWRVHFGLGKATKAERVIVNWPSGVRQELVNVQANQVLEIREK
jgi:hypothetical protein